MPLSALALALAAAFVHALWNLLLARARDPEAATAVALVVAVVAFAPVAVFTWELDRAAWPYLGGSATFQLAYVALLAAAYRRAELSLVYPLARGGAPVLVLLFGVTVLGASTSPLQAAGVSLVAVGILLVHGVKREADVRGLVFAFAIAGCIAGYTLIDNDGIHHGSPIAYLEVELLPSAILYAGVLVAFKGFRSVCAEVTAASIVAGLCMFGAYALVLAALARAPAAPVAAVRETSIVIAAALAGVVLRERVGPVRLAGAVLVAGGVALLAG